MKKCFIFIVFLFILGCMSNKDVMDAEDECIKRGRIPVYSLTINNSVTKVNCFSEREYIRWGLDKK
jgi:hypothetical protein